jgi:hypothetical protein
MAKEHSGQIVSQTHGTMEKLINEIFDDHIGIAAELSGYVEILNTLQTEVSRFDGSETQAERISAQDSLHALWRSMERFKDAWDDQVSGYANRLYELRNVDKVEMDAACKKCWAKFDLEKCEGCNVREKGWCSPLKRWQCENGYDNESFIHLLILSLRGKNHILMDIAKRTKDTEVINN